MSCITSTITPQPRMLSLGVTPQPKALTMTCALVCGSSLGTVELLYVDEGVLLTDNGEVMTVRRQ